MLCNLTNEQSQLWLRVVILKNCQFSIAFSIGKKLAVIRFYTVLATVTSVGILLLDFKMIKQRGVKLVVKPNQLAVNHFLVLKICENLRIEPIHVLFVLKPNLLPSEWLRSVEIDSELSLNISDKYGISLLRLNINASICNIFDPKNSAEFVNRT